MIQAIIFDFFGVLVTEGLKQFLDTYFGEDADKRRQALELVKAFNRGHTSSYDELVAALASRAGIKTSEVAEYLEDNRPNKLLLDFIRTELKPKYKLGILSNAGDDWVAQLLPGEDEKLFDDKVLSYKFGMTKPNASIYQLAAERLEVHPTACVFVDDTIGHCEGARLTGMKTIVYDTFPDFKRQINEILSSDSNN